jgi:hypothetical protein
MAALGDISTALHVTIPYESFYIAIPAWPDVSLAIPIYDGSPPPSGGDIPGFILFN